MCDMANVVYKGHRDLVRVRGCLPVCSEFSSNGLSSNGLSSNGFGGASLGVLLFARRSALTCHHWLLLNLSAAFSLQAHLDLRSSRVLPAALG